MAGFRLTKVIGYEYGKVNGEGKEGRREREQGKGCKVKRAKERVQGKESKGREQGEWNAEIIINAIKGKEWGNNLKIYHIGPWSNLG